MNTHQGWIKLYRCLLDDPVWQCGTAEQKVILVTLLLMANHAERKWQWQGRPFVCKPGQMITSLKSIQQKCGKKISIRKIQLALIRFERMGFLSKQTSKTNTLLTICNWAVYQDGENANVKDTVHKMSTPRHRPATPVLTNKNEKNGKNEKKNKSFAFSSLSFEQQDIHRAQAANTQAMETFMGETPSS